MPDWQDGRRPAQRRAGARSNGLDRDGKSTDMDNLEARIRAILAEQDLAGSFRYERVASNGQRFVHSCSHAVGMSLVAARQAYRSAFGPDLPEWVEILAPEKAAAIYRLTVAAGRRLAQAPYREQIALRRRHGPC